MPQAVGGGGKQVAHVRFYRRIVARVGRQRNTECGQKAPVGDRLHQPRDAAAGKLVVLLIVGLPLRHPLVADAVVFAHEEGVQSRQPRLLVGAYVARHEDAHQTARIARHARRVGVEGGAVLAVERVEGQQIAVGGFQASLGVSA